MRKGIQSTQEFRNRSRYCRASFGSGKLISMIASTQIAGHAQAFRAQNHGSLYFSFGVDAVLAARMPRCVRSQLWPARLRHDR
ncbi:hypothetical protein BX592_102368 [Paraburkholderia rhizosphaerae]|uniref:Uncharacterized protein n=1 Tax=Paraburkholderia rhizosphaerae TaxID=480658 RepID=A0A4R8LZS0_9BURK|nr:hypothetical protein BX592_102368 [Paraburkholderia rhizosphaerae]